MSQREVPVDPSWGSKYRVVSPRVPIAARFRVRTRDRGGTRRGRREEGRDARGMVDEGLLSGSGRPNHRTRTGPGPDSRVFQTLCDPGDPSLTPKEEGSARPKRPWGRGRDRGCRVRLGGARDGTTRECPQGRGPRVGRDGRPVQGSGERAA